MLVEKRVLSRLHIRCNEARHKNLSFSLNFRSTERKSGTGHVFNLQQQYFCIIKTIKYMSHTSRFLLLFEGKTIYIGLF